MNRSSQTRPKPRLAFRIFAVVFTLGIAAGLFAVAATRAAAQVSLVRQSGRCEGSLRYVLAGVPVFWRTLDGLAEIEREEIQRREKAQTSGAAGQMQTVSRLVFRDASGKELAWTERAALLNEHEAIVRFLAGSGETYSFTEPSRILRNSAHPVRSIGGGILGAVLVGVGWLLFFGPGPAALLSAVRSWRNKASGNPNTL